MVTPPLRCHLLIGPPASGKSTLATELAQHTGAVVLANDAIRAEIFGDVAVQGPWSAIEAVLHTRLKEAVASGQPVILDGTHSQRPWRLAILQALELPTPVQWIGWWLTTPLEHCLAWNQQRPRQVEERVIRQMVSVLPTSVYEPAAAQQKKLLTDPGQRREMLQRWQERFLDRQRSLFREEGFAAVVAIDPSAITTSLSSAIQDITSGLDFQIQMAIHRTAKIEVHGYSRLLDLERLIFLIRLLLESPGVELADPLVERELRASFRFEPNAPLPDEPVLSFATRAANALRRRHGSPFGEESDVVVDLNWLKLKKQEWQKQRQHADDLSSPHPWLAQDGSIQGTGLNPWICSTHVFTNCSLTNQRNPSTMSLLRHCQRK